MLSDLTGHKQPVLMVTLLDVRALPRFLGGNRSRRAMDFNFADLPEIMCVPRFHRDVSRL